jgi:hypothetical protein
VNTDFSLSAIVDASSSLLFLGVGLAAAVRGNHLTRVALCGLALAAAAALDATLGGLAFDANWLGLLFVGLPVVMWRADRSLLLAALSLGAAGATVASTLFPPFWGPDYPGALVGRVVMVCEALASVAGVLLALRITGRESQRALRPWLFVAVAVLVIDEILANIVWGRVIGPLFDTPTIIGTTLSPASSILVAGAAIGFARSADSRTRRGLAALGFGLGIISIFSSAQPFGVNASLARGSLSDAQYSRLLEPTTLAWNDIGFALDLLIAAAPIVAWIAASQRHDGRVARNVALGLVLGGLAGLALPVFGGTRDFGGYAIIRTIGVVALALAVFRHDVLGVGFAWAPRRGALGLAALGALFIVAQVAQNFFAAQYGLLLGGVIAGCFLFAAQPVQRMIERRGERRVTVGSASVREQTAFKAAVRAALAEGPLTPRQVEHLSEVAESLGIGPKDMTRLKHEVENEGAEVRLKETES